MDYVRHTYYLDSSIRRGSIVKITVTSNRKTPSDTGYIVGGDLYEWSFSTRETSSSAFSADLYGENVGGSYNTTGDEVFGKVHFNEGKIELYFDAPPPVDGSDNIIVEFEANNKDISYLTNLFEFEISHSGILFFKGVVHDFKTNEYNTFLCFTDVKSKFYIPSSNYIMLNYTGFIPLTDNTLGAFTETGITYLVRSEEKIGDDLIYTYRSYEGQTGEKLIAKESIQTLSNEPLFLSENGVFAMKLSENIKSNERYAIERSSFINSVLTKHSDLSKAKSIVFKNRYYLSIDNSVYIADARYKTSARDIDMNDVINYEWWEWENIPVDKWIVIDDQLHFINKNSNLCQFVENREDINITLVGCGNESYGYFAPISTSHYLYQFDLTKIELLNEGNEVECESYYETKKFIIKNVDKTKGTFCLQKYESVDGEYIDNSEIIFGSDSNGSSYKVFLIDKKNVVSEWYTPIINMGTSLYSKNLLTSTLVFEPNIEGEVKYGYLTRRKNETIYKNSALNPSNGVDFDDIDFTDFSFAVGFAVSRTLKTRVRNFNFIQFRIVSDTNKDCALNNFTITYNIGRKNKGVR